MLLVLPGLNILTILGSNTQCFSKINRTMDNKNTPQPVPQVQRSPDENAGLFFTSHIKITDPNTKEVLVQMRAD
jgi:hypothetical protein